MFLTLICICYLVIASFDKINKMKICIIGHPDSGKSYLTSALSNI